MDRSTCPNCEAPVAPDARFCASCGSTLDSTAAEERKLATILFADVIGSTDLGEQLDPERLRAMLQDYFGQMSRVIEEWSGTVEKYIGDAILAVFGVPTAREDDPIRALHAARDMLERLDQVNDDFEQRHGVRLAVRIGVNTGEVLAPMGARAGGQFLVSGDPVNVASRLQQAADPGSVMVGERTWSAARDAFEFGPPVALTVKGKREPVEARRLGAATNAEGRGVRFQAPMVGRDRELATLLGLLDEAVETELPRLVILSGSAGIGKSRMLREFIASASERQPTLSVLRGRCLAAGHGITFWALGEILRAASGMSLDEPVETAVEKLRGTVQEVLEPMGVRQTELDETFFALATSANLHVADNPLERIEPEGVGEEMARAWPRFLTGLAARSPTAIILEDLHWADERLVAMIESLAGRSSGPSIVIGTVRPEFLETHPRFAASAEVTLIALRPLTEGQSEQLIVELLGNSDPHQALLMDVRQKADGNPFFLEEILQRLIDEGALVRQDGRWVATDVAQGVRLPDTIHALLAARIDALPAAEKVLVQQAAVVGRTFWPGSLASAADGRDPIDVLRSLERRGLVSARTSSTIEGQPEYIFRHVLIRDVAYASVPKARRARAHAETARWIEALAADRLDEFGELLAYHFAAAAAGEDADLAWVDQPAERTELRLRAIAALLSAGNAARRRFAVDKAIELHEQARALASTDSEQIDILEALGDDHEALLHMDEAVEMYFAALESARLAHDEDTTSVARLAIKLGGTAKRWGAFKEAPPYLQIRMVVEDALRRDVGERNRAELQFTFSWLTGQSPRRSRPALSEDERSSLPHAIALAEEGLAVALRLDDAELLYQGYEALTLLYWTTGDIGSYRAATAEQAKLLEHLPSRREKVDALTTVASAMIESGQYSQGLEAAERSFELAADLSPHERMHGSFEVMLAANALGDWDRVVEVLPWHAEAAAGEPGITCPNVRGGGPLGATVLVWRGEVARAREMVPVDESALDRQTLFDRSLIARYACLVGRPDVAAAIVDQQLTDPERVRYPDGMDAFLETLFLLGRDDELAEFTAHARNLAGADAQMGPLAARTEAQLLMRRGGTAAARPLLELAVHGFDDLTIPFEAARTRELLAELVDEPRRSELLNEALQTYERLGARPFVERIRAQTGAR